ncbi:Cyclic pyranopterin monophosphate synthase [Streptomyces glaucescens]
MGAVADDAETLRTAIEDQLVRADLMVTTGGVSVGAYDVVKEALAHVADEDEPGSGVEFRKLAMQPGKPQGFGSIGPDHTPLLALPGNPVSSYVSFELFVRPAIRTLMGLTDVHRPTTRATLTADKPLTSPKGRRQFLRGRYADGTVDPGRRGRVPPGRGPRARRRADRRPRGRGVRRARHRRRGGPARLTPRGWRYRVAHNRPARRTAPGPDRERHSVSTQDRLTHIDDAGAARMVDVSEKDVTARTARASGRVLVSPRVVELLRGEGVPKGDALATARIAGIMGAKRTPT